MSKGPDLELAARRIRKFLARADVALASPLFAHGRRLFQMQLEVQVEGGVPTVIAMNRPEIELRDLKTAIVDCRPFFLSTEDAFLPSVVSALSQLATPEHARGLRGSGLKKYILQFVNNDGLVGGQFMYAGRVEEDNGADEPGELLSSGQIAMDYIYGVALHEDDERLSRLENLGGGTTMLYATAMELAHLIRAVATLREQIRASGSDGHLSIAVEVGEPSAWSDVRPPEPADDASSGFTKRMEVTRLALDPGGYGNDRGEPES